MIKFSKSLNSYENMVIKNQFSLNYKHDCDLGLGNGTLNLLYSVWCSMAVVGWGEILGCCRCDNIRLFTQYYPRLPNMVRREVSRDYADAM